MIIKKTQTKVLLRHEETPLVVCCLFCERPSTSGRIVVVILTPPAVLHYSLRVLIMEELFLRNVQHLRKMFTYMCSQCTAPEDPISNMACQFLHGRLHVSFGVSGVSFFEDGVIYPYFYLTREQRQFLYSIAGAIARDPQHAEESLRQQQHRYRFCNGCLVMTDFTGKTLDQRLVWRVILECVAASPKHQDCLRMLANVVIQRILCRAQHSKDMVAYVYELAEEIFPVDSEPASRQGEEECAPPIEADSVSSRIST